MTSRILSEEVSKHNNSEPYLLVRVGHEAAAATRRRVQRYAAAGWTPLAALINLQTVSQSVSPSVMPCAGGAPVGHVI